MKRLLIVAASGLILCLSCSGKQQEAEKVDFVKKPVATPPLALALPDSVDSDTLAAVVYPIRSKDNPLVTIETDFGRMVIELYRDVAPAHADSFLARTKDGFYDGTIFQRIVNRFMIQGGDPTGTGRGGAGYYLNAEFSNLPHQEGTLSMARAQSPNSASSQFFICLERNNLTSNLDGKYTVFGQLHKGYDVLSQLGAVPCVANPGNPREISKPVDSVFLRRAYISDTDGSEIK